MKENAIKILGKKLKEQNFTNDEFPCMEFPNDLLLDSQSFFPYGSGFYYEKPDYNKVDIMVLGQDWGKDNQSAGKGSTWRVLKEMDSLFGGNILKRCFFTNCYMGKRISGNGVKATGALKKHFKKNKCNWDDFKRLNIEYFEKQLFETSIKKILVLGLEPAFFVGEFFGISEWYKEDREQKWIDIRDNTILNAKFKKNSHIDLFLIPHPSNLNLNLKYYGGNKEKAKNELNLNMVLKKCFSQVS